jgi:hypothetical protein
MSNTNTGGPAFPGTQYANGIQPSGFNQGITLRDYFAAKALQGLLANPKLSNEILKHGGAVGGWIEDSAWAFSDAMLKAREE